MIDQLIRVQEDERCPECKETTGAFVLHLWDRRGVTEIRECRKCGHEISSRDITDQFKPDPDVDSTE